MTYVVTGDGTVSDTEIFAGRTRQDGAPGTGGTVTLTSGAYSVQLFEAGVPAAGEAPTVGTITLAGGGTSVAVEDPGSEDFPAAITIGRDNPGGEAFLFLDNGATLVSRNTLVPDTGADYAATSGVFIGRGEIEYAEATVSGPGSALLTEGLSPRINVGTGAGGGRDTEVGFRDTPLEALQGSLVLESGGYARAVQVEVGREEGRGFLVVKGEGSELRADASGGGFAGSAYAGEGGFINIGRSGGRGYVAVRDGGRIVIDTEDGVTDNATLRLARDAGSYGYLVVEGEGSRVEMIQRGPAGDQYSGGGGLVVGRSGEGVVLARDGAEIGILGDEAVLLVGDRDREGGSFTSRLEILSGAGVLVDSSNPDPAPGDVETDFLGAHALIGNNPGSSGAVTVSGEGSTFVLRGDDLDTGLYGTYQQSNYATGRVVVGNRGEGALTVSDGGLLRARDMQLGWSNIYGDDGPTGEGGSGTATVASGGQIEILSYAATPYQGVRVGSAAYGTGTLTVTGAGSRLTITGGETATEGAGEGAARLEVGEYGTGAVAVEDGGYLGAFFFQLGRRGGSSATVTVDGVADDGTRSTLRGSDAFGTFLEFVDGEPTGAQTNGSTFMRIGREDGATGSVAVTGGGLIWMENDPEADKVFPFIRIGQEQGARGSLTVDGIARDAEGAPILDGEGAEIRSELRLVQNPVSEGAEARGGVGIDIGGGFGAVETNGTGLLTVSNRGLVTLSGNEAGLSVGEADPGAPPEGGESRQSRLAIESGGEVILETDADATGLAFLDVGVRAGGDGAVTVTGEGSLLSLTARRAEEVEDENTSAIVTVGRAGTGRLDVLDGGRVVIDGTNGVFPGLQIGRSEEGTGDGTVAVSGAGSGIVIAGTNESVLGASGFITVGRFDGDRGTLEISDGGRVALTGARDTVTGVAATDGAAGTIRVLGEGSVLEAGRYLIVGGDVDETAPAGPGNALTEEALLLSEGAGTLFVRGGTVTAEEIHVGPASLLDAVGEVAGATTVLGRFEIGEREVGILELAGDLALADGATLGLDVRTGGGIRVWDVLEASGRGEFDLAAIDVDLLAPDRLFLGDDRLVVAEFAGGIETEGTARIGNRSALLDLVAEDGQLFLRQGSSVSFEQARTVGLLYEIGLDRDGQLADDLDGFNFNIDAREQGVTETQLAELFIEGPEFVDRFGEIDDLSNPQYVELLYDNALGRISDPDGFDFWVRALDAGLPKPEALVFFAKSPENQDQSAYLDDLEEIEPGFWGFA